MRIIQCLEGKSWSGGQQQALFLCKGLLQRGIEVLLICSNGSVLANKARQQRINVIELPFKRELDIQSLIALNNICKKFNPDIVNVHRAWVHTMWLLISIIRRFKGLVVTRRVQYKPDFNPLSKIKYCNKFIAGFIAVSKNVADKLIEFGVKKEKIKVIYSATDTNRFNPNCVNSNYLYEEMPNLKKCNVALMIGNYSKNKGYHLVLDAFSNITDLWNNLHLVIVGKDTEKLITAIKDSKIKEKIHLLGFREDIPELINIADFTINASYEEGFVGSIRESAAMGKPILASDIQSNKEYSEFIPMYYFKVGSSDDLANKLLFMKHIVNNSQLQKKLRESAVEYFSVDKMVERTLHAYKVFRSYTEK